MQRTVIYKDTEDFDSHFSNHRRRHDTSDTKRMSSYTNLSGSSHSIAKRGNIFTCPSPFVRCCLRTEKVSRTVNRFLKILIRTAKMSSAAQIQKWEETKGVGHCQCVGCIRRGPGARRHVNTQYLDFVLVPPTPLSQI